MKPLASTLLAAVFLFLLIFQPNPAPAQASSTISPGFYVGWVSFLGRTDFDGNLTVQDAHHHYLWTGKYQGQGQLMIKINAAGAGGASIVLPTTDSLIDSYELNIPQGSCLFTGITKARSNYVHLRGAPAAMGDTFQVPFKPATALSFTYEESNSFVIGDIVNCDKFAVLSLPVGRTTIQGNLALVSAIQFQTKYHSDTEMGGSCSLPGWNQSFTFPPFTTPNVYSLPQCSWRVFKTGQTNPQKGWQ